MWPFGNLDIGIGISIFSFLYSINSLHVISNKVATYRLEACDFVRKCFAKISRRKFSDNLKSYREEPIWENLYAGVPF